MSPLPSVYSSENQEGLSGHLRSSLRSRCFQSRQASLTLLFGAPPGAFLRGLFLWAGAEDPGPEEG